MIVSLTVYRVPFIVYRYGKRLTVNCKRNVIFKIGVACPGIFYGNDIGVLTFDLDMISFLISAKYSTLQK